MAIKVELELDTGDFERGIIRANTKLSDLQNAAGATVVGMSRLGGEAKSFMSTMRDATIILGQAGNAMETLHHLSTGWMGEIVKLNAEVERMSALLKAMSTAADPVKEASNYIRNLREEAKQAPFSLQAMHQAFIRMKSGGLDPAAGSMKSLVDAVAAFGGTDETLGRASLAFQEMAGKGVVQMKELRNQLGMAVPQSMALMARSFGLTYQELMSDVHTGTVDAKNAIQSLNLEFERVYGGSAQRQMETFNGQLARMKVIAMDLAIKAGGADDLGMEKGGGFFDTTKKQFKELNDMLSGSAGERLAGNVGEGLSQIVLMLRRAIDTAIEFRSTIASVGQAMLIGFGGQMVINSMAGLVTAITTARTAIAELTITWGIARAAFATGGAIGAASAGMAAFGATALAIAPHLALIAGGLALAANAFGLFGNKAKDAYEEMVKFGAYSRESVKLGEERVKQLDEEIARYERMRKTSMFVPDWLNGRIDNLKKQRDEADKNVKGFDQNVTKEEARKSASVAMDEINDQIAAQRRVYSEQASYAAKAYDEEVKKVAASGKSALNLRRQYQEDVKAAALQSYDAQINVLEQFIDKYQQLSKTGTDIEKKTSETMLEELRKRVDEQTKLKAQEAERQVGSGKTPKLMDDDKLLGKGETFLQKIRDEIEGLKGAFQGLDPQVEQLRSALENMKFGDGANESVRQLIDEIVAAKQEAEDLHKIINGKDKLDTDILNTKVKAQQELIELQTRGMSDADKLRVKIKSGFYDGFGEANSPMQQRLIDLRLKMEQIGGSANATGDILKNATFGADATNAARGYLDIVSKISATFGGLQQSASAMSLGAPFGPAGTGIPLLDAGKGGGYYANLFRQEASNNPNAAASTSSALGLGQFTEGTWLEFIKTMHADMLSLGDKIVLEKRKDPELMKEATEWLARTNAGKLANAGIPTSDANVYAAHFLGAGGATSLLKHDDLTALASIPELAKALNSNAFLRGMTVGDFKSFTNSRFGGGASWQNGVDQPFAGKYLESSKLANPVNMTGEQKRNLSDIDQIIEKGAETKAFNNITDEAKRLKGLLSEAMEMEEGNNKRLAALKKLIGAGKLDDSDKNWESRRYHELIDLAKKLDDQEQKTLNAKKARTAAEGGRGSINDALLAQKEAYSAAWTGFGDPQSASKFSEQMTRLDVSLTKHLDHVKAVYGEDSQVYRKELEKKNQALELHSDAEVVKYANTLSTKTQELRRSLMTEDAARRDTVQKAIEYDQNMLERFKGTAEDHVRVEAAINDHIAALRAKSARDGAIGKMFDSWSDGAKNFENQMASSMSSVTDTVAGSLVGVKANWSNVLQSLSKDMMSLALRFSLGSVGKMGKDAGGGTGIMGLIGGLVGLHHSGGIVGREASFYRNVSASLFNGARRFHEGGMIGPDEVPIIAKKGEGVFTPQQMAALGGAGGSKVNIAMPVTVNASGGSPQQNKDLANQVGRQVEQIARGIVMDEVMKQMRPGNSLYSRYGRG